MNTIHLEDNKTEIETINFESIDFVINFLLILSGLYIVFKIIKGR